MLRVNMRTSRTITPAVMSWQPQRWTCPRCGARGDPRFHDRLPEQRFDGSTTDADAARSRDARPHDLTCPPIHPQARVVRFGASPVRQHPLLLAADDPLWSGPSFRPEATGRPGRASVVLATNRHVESVVVARSAEDRRSRCAENQAFARIDADGHSTASSAFGRSTVAADFGRRRQAARALTRGAGRLRALRR
jgi:hypothetical protein